MNILFLLTGNTSFDEVILTCKFIDQFSDKHNIYCLTPNLLAHYFFNNNLVTYGSWLDDKEKNLNNLELLFSKINFDLIIWSDILSAVFEEIDSNIPLDWLNTISIPLGILDYQGSLCILTNTLDSNEYETIVSLKNSSQKFTFRHINNVYHIKSCPPNLYIEQDNILYWKNFEDFSLLAKYQLKESLHDKNYFNENTKVVMLLFNLPAIIKSSIEDNKINFDIHYQVIANLIVYYLKIVMSIRNSDCQLFICNFSKLEEFPYPDIKINSNLKITEINVLTHELYNNLTKISDLILTECNWHPLLMNAIGLEIPTLVLGSNVAIEKRDNKNIIVSDYTDMDMYVYNQLELILKQNPNKIYPYISYPYKIDFLPKEDFIQNGYCYHLTDVFNDQRTVNLIDTLLFNKDYLKELEKVFKYYKEQNIYALTSEQIIKFITKK